ncbi:MAG TPA: helix-turn-helix transcriptional regulator [Solirubrobacterales bacterium]
MTKQRISRQFGRNLAEARGWVGMSQTQLAQELGVRQSQVARLENGERCPSLYRLMTLADAVGVQVRDLLYGIE